MSNENTEGKPPATTNAPRPPDDKDAKDSTQHVQDKIVEAPREGAERKDNTRGTS